MKKIMIWGLLLGNFCVCSALTLNVSSNALDENADGSAEKPFASLQQAIDAVKLFQSQGANGNIEILLSEGVYCFKDKGSLAEGLTSKHAPMEIKGKGKVEFVGGVRVPASELKEVKDEEILSRLPAEREGKLYFLDLKKYGISDCGKIENYGFAHEESLNLSEAFYDGKNTRLARYPNAGILMPVKVVDKGVGKSRKKYGGIFEYAGDRPSRWINSLEEMRIAGAITCHYAFSTAKIKKIDIPQRQIVVDTNMNLLYGLWWPDISNVSGYYAFNLLEEADADGEYYIDRKNCVFYIMLKNPPKAGEYVDFSTCREPILKISNCSNLKISNIKFSACVGDALSLFDVSNIAVENCDFFNIGAHACLMGSAKRKEPLPRPYSGRFIPISGGSKNVAFRNCKISRTGYSGIMLVGGDEETLERAGNLVENCEFVDCGRWDRSYSPGIRMMGVGAMVRHCSFTNFAHQAIEFMGSCFTIENNYFADCCREFSDLGVIYTDRRPTDVGNVIRGNFFTNIFSIYGKAAMCGVYLDDGTSNVLVKNNILCRTGARTGFAAMHLHGGKLNSVLGNVFIECPGSVSNQYWTDEKWSKKAAKWSWHEKNPAYLKLCPTVADMSNPTLLRYNTMLGCRFYNTPAPYIGILILRNNKTLVPRVPMGKVDFWTPAEVEKYFGDDAVVINALKGKPGILK